MSTSDAESDFEFYLRFVKPLIFNLQEPQDRVLAAAWVQKLMDKHSGSECLRTSYLKLLLFVLQRKNLRGIFLENPNQVKGLEQLSEANLHEVAKDLLVAEKELQECPESGDFPPYCTEHSPDLLEYSAVQYIPNFGVHAYYAVSNEPLPTWDRTEKAVFPRGIIRRSTTRIKVTTSRFNATGSAPSLDEQSVIEKNKTIRRSRSGNIIRRSLTTLQSRFKSRRNKSKPSGGDNTLEREHPVSTIRSEARRASPRRNKMSTVPLSSPLGTNIEEIEEEIRDIPMWGSNLIRVSEPPIWETAPDLPDYMECESESIDDSVCYGSSIYRGLPYQNQWPRRLCRQDQCMPVMEDPYMPIREDPCVPIRQELCMPCETPISQICPAAAVPEWPRRPSRQDPCMPVMEDPCMPMRQNPCVPIRQEFCMPCGTPIPQTCPAAAENYYFSEYQTNYFQAESLSNLDVPDKAAFRSPSPKRQVPVVLNERAYNVNRRFHSFDVPEEGEMRGARPNGQTSIRVDKIGCDDNQKLPSFDVPCERPLPRESIPVQSDERKFDLSKKPPIGFPRKHKMGASRPRGQSPVRQHKRNVYRRPSNYETSDEDNMRIVQPNDNISVPTYESDFGFIQRPSNFINSCQVDTGIARPVAVTQVSVSGNDKSIEVNQYVEVDPIDLPSQGEVRVARAKGQILPPIAEREQEIYNFDISSEGQAEVNRIIKKTILSTKKIDEDLKAFDRFIREYEKVDFDV